METEDRKSRDELLLQKLRQIVLENLQNDQFSVEDLAQFCGISRSQLHRKLGKLKKKSISQFIREIRLTEALKLLQKNTGTVSEVAYEVGFSNPNYFSTSFRDYYGYPPGEASLRMRIQDKPIELKAPLDSEILRFPRSNKGILYLIIISGFLLILVGTFFVLPKESDSNFKSSIAVLAFTDMSEEKNQEYFVDGICEEIIHKLTKYKDLKVMGRTSSFFYKNRATRLDRIGQELGVAYLLEGSVRKSGNKFRITVQLIQVSDGTHVWSNTFDREIENVLYTQDEIASIIAQRLNVTLLNEDVRLRKVDPKAYELYLKSKQALSQTQELPTELADSLIRKSIDIDSTYSPAWAQLARITYHRTFYYENINLNEGILFGKNAAVKALKLDSEHPEAYIQMAFFEWESKDVNSSLEFLELANNIAPNDYRVLGVSGTFAIRTNQLAEAKKYLLRSLEVNPKASDVMMELGILQWYNGDLEKAESNFELYFDLNASNYLENYYLASIYCDLAKYDKVLQCINREKNPYIQLFIKCRYAHAIGKIDEAKARIEEFRSYPKDNFRLQVVSTPEQHYFEVALLYAYIGDADEAFFFLDKAYNHIRHFTDWLFSQHEFKNIQSDPRWDDLINRLNADFNYDFSP